MASFNFDDGSCFSLDKNGSGELKDSSGKLISALKFSNGKLHGECVQYYEMGAVMSVSHYANGVLHGSFVTYYESGIVQMTANYVAGKYDGIVTLYDEFGDLVSETSYKNGVKHGKCLRYHVAGNGVSEISYYENGLLEGDKLTINTHGEVTSIVHYLRGRPQNYPGCP